MRDQAAPLEVVEEVRVDGHAGPSGGHGHESCAPSACRMGEPVPTRVLRRLTAVPGGSRMVIAGRYTLEPRDRPRRHGRRLARPRRGARAAGRAQADRRRSRRRTPPTSSAPSARPGWPPGSTTPTWSRSSTWSTEGDEHWLVMEYVEGTHARRADPAATARSTPDEAAPLLAPGRRRAGRRARRRDRAPRREAVQHPGDAPTAR